MAVTSRRRPSGSIATLLAIIICMAVCTNMASAWWQDICTLGDTYVERLATGATDCNFCTNWCQGKCPNLKGSMVRSECINAGGNCQCCCSKPPTAGPSLPPTPSTAPIFTNGDTSISICTTQQTYLQIPHTKGSDCAYRPQCDDKCKEKGAFVSAGSQCIGTSSDGEEKAYVWIEQCCCKAAPPPPPPPPSPPPPSPPPPSPSPPSPSPYPSPSCGCCASDINIQIRVTSGCGAKSSTPSTCGVKSSAPSPTYITL
ncbi:hypothetical protein MKX03_036803 [Papaver bracteatum]|nr:hypothetical protein MKX03_036803 [Papaver bracteatum]